MEDRGKGLRFVTISGSYRKFIDEVAFALDSFRNAGVTVLSPKSASILSSVDGFVSLRGDPILRIDLIADDRFIEAMTLIENSHLHAIQQSDALWVVLPTNYCGAATALEIGWALAHRVPVFYDARYSQHIKEPIIKSYATPVQGIDHLIKNFHSMPSVDLLVSRYFTQQLLFPSPSRRRSDTYVDSSSQPYRNQSYRNESYPNPPNYSGFNAVIAVGPLIVNSQTNDPETLRSAPLLFVKTHKWSGRYSIVGGRIKHHEPLTEAFSRVTLEQTGLEGALGETICAFNEIPDSGYFQPESRRIFIDNMVAVSSHQVRLDSRAQEYVWIPPNEALRELDLEPNARKTIEIYIERQCGIEPRNHPTNAHQPTPF